MMLSSIIMAAAWQHLLQVRFVLFKVPYFEQTLLDIFITYYVHVLSNNNLTHETTTHCTCRPNSKDLQRL